MAAWCPRERRQSSSASTNVAQQGSVVASKGAVDPESIDVPYKCYYMVQVAKMEEAS